MWKRLLMVLCLFMCGCHSSADARADTVEFGILHFPPYYIIADRQYSGLTVTLIDELMSRAAIPYTINQYPVHGLYRRITAGKTVFAGIVGVPAYDGSVYYSDKIYTIELRLYTAGNRSLEGFPEVFKGKKVITILGYSYSGLIAFLRDTDNEIERLTPKSHLVAFSMLEKGRGDYLLDYRYPAIQALQTLGLSDFDYVVVSTLDVHFVIPREFPNAKILLGKVNSVLRELRAEGFLDKLYKLDES